MQDDVTENWNHRGGTVPAPARRAVLGAAAWAPPAVVAASAAPAFAGSQDPAEPQAKYGRGIWVSATATERVPAVLENEYVTMVTFRVDFNRDLEDDLFLMHQGFTGTGLAAGTELVIRSSMDWGSMRDELLVEGGYDDQMLGSRRWHSRGTVFIGGDGAAQSFASGTDFTDSGPVRDGADYHENGLEKYGNRNQGHARGQDWRRTLRLKRDPGAASTFVFTCIMTSPLDWVTRRPFAELSVNPVVLPSTQYAFLRQTHKTSVIVTVNHGGDVVIV